MSDGYMSVGRMLIPGKGGGYPLPPRSSETKKTTGPFLEAQTAHMLNFTLQELMMMHIQDSLASFTPRPRFRALFPRLPLRIFCVYVSTPIRFQDRRRELPRFRELSCWVSMGINKSLDSEISTMPSVHSFWDMLSAPTDQTSRKMPRRNVLRAEKATLICCAHVAGKIEVLDEVSFSR